MATVTIAKSYFEALLRRGEFHTDSSPVPPPDGCVTISQAEYGQLMRQVREYSILRGALLRGGLNQDTLELLIAGGDAQQEPDVAESWDHNTFQRPTPVFVSITKPSDYQPTPDSSEQVAMYNGVQQHGHTGMNNRSYSFGALESPTSYDQDKEDGCAADGGEGINGNWRKNMDNWTSEQRTLQFSNLPERTTHAELTSIVKGGILLDIYVRNDRTATVSFVSGAKEYLNYAKKTDVYLRTKRVEVSWSDRQFRLPAHVANKIQCGASRNVVVRNGLSRELTEQGIRDDLDHIHNLVVIGVKLNHKTGDIFISTNSVHNALFARTCMMSRSLYKGLKIEYYPDECNVPVPKIPERVPVVVPVPTAKAPTRSFKPPTSSNMYALLAEDGACDESASSTLGVEEPALPGHTDNGVKINWADSVAVA